MIRVVRKFRGLSRAERGDLVRGTPLLVVVWALLPLAGIKRVRRWTGGGSAAGSGAQVDFAAWERRALALRRVGARLPGCRCLARALALSWWMARAGVPHSVRIGVTGSAVDLASHAWVEVGGVAVGEDSGDVGRFRGVWEL